MADTWLPGLPAIGGAVGDAFADLLLYADPSAANLNDRDLKISPHELFVLRTRKYSTFFDDLYTVGLVSQQNSGTGSEVNQSNQGTASHPGVLECSTGTDTTGAAGVFSFNAYAFVPGGGRIKFLSYFKTPSALSNGTNRYALFTGLTRASLVYKPSEWLGIYYRDDVSANWQAICRNGGTETTQNIAVAVATDSWYRFEIDIDAVAANVTCSVNGTSASAISTNIPTAESFFCVGQVIKALGTTARSIYPDGYGWSQNLATAR
ncbi:MAG TPA: hypothetical protein VJ890_24920 [Vineibacter sp.]|nr:hypothetical protein [Vineibacter sp.]